MRRILYLAGILIFTYSCKSVQDLVDKGDYDGAIQLAAKKLSGDENKKTKHVKGLETAFAKVMQRDLEYIDHLKSTNREENWDRIYDRFFLIKNRQEKITPFLPLVSKDGYVAHFKFIRVYPLLDEAAGRASAYHYQKAYDMLIEAENYSNKNTARNSFEEFDMIDKYYDDFKDTKSLQEKAHYLGTNRFELTTRNLTKTAIPIRMEEELLEINISEMNSFWQEFYIDPPSDLRMDYKAIFEIHHLDVSAERERERIYTDEKEIKDGLRYILDENGNVKKDSLGNDMKEPNYVVVRADVIELTREKNAIVHGNIEILDLNNGDVVATKPVEALVQFNSFASRYNGDKRALQSKTKSRLRDYPEPFPSDYSMIMQATDEIKYAIKDYLVHHIF